MGNQKRAEVCRVSPFTRIQLDAEAALNTLRLWLETEDGVFGPEPESECKHLSVVVDTLEAHSESFNREAREWGEEICEEGKIKVVKVVCLECEEDLTEDEALLVELGF